MCCENARSHHSPFSRFPPRSAFRALITPRSVLLVHRSLLPFPARSTLSARSSFSCSPRSLITHHSSFRASRSPALLVHSLAYQLVFIAPRSHHSAFRASRSSLPAHHSSLCAHYSSFSAFRALFTHRSARSSLLVLLVSPLPPFLVHCSLSPRVLITPRSMLRARSSLITPASRSLFTFSARSPRSARCFLITLHPLVPRRPRAPPIRAFLVSTPITPPNPLPPPPTCTTHHYQLRY